MEKEFDDELEDLLSCFDAASAERMREELRKKKRDPEYWKKMEEKMRSVEDWFSDPMYEDIKEEIEAGTLPPMEQWFWDEKNLAPSFKGADGDIYGLNDISEFGKQVSPYNELGAYGRMHLDYLLSNQRGKFLSLLSSGKLYDHCFQIEEEALERGGKMEREQMKPYKELQNTNFLQYVQIRNNIHAAVEEVLREELLFQ